jgi:hypothetical protein
MRFKAEIQKLFDKKKVLTLVDICLKFDCAPITARKYLKDFDYLSSYNQNSQFYTLSKFAKFDELGIWRYKEKLFTKYRTLENLIVSLIDRSVKGYSSKEIESIVKVKVWVGLGKLTKRKKVRKVQFGGECFYFTSKGDSKSKIQLKRRFRKKEIDISQYENWETVERLRQTILILLEIIRKHPQSNGQLCGLIAKRYPEISSTQVNDIIREHGLSLKKKPDLLKIFDLVTLLFRQIRRDFDPQFVLEFIPEIENCPVCNRSLKVWKKSPSRQVETIRFGRVHFREIEKYCPDHIFDNYGERLVFTSSFLSQLAPRGWQVGYDALVHIGKQRFFNLKQIKEIKSELLRYDISFSPSSISHYIDCFLAMVECLHITKIKKLRMLIEQNGGYLLHIDCSREKTSDTVFICTDKVTGAILLSEKVPSENSIFIKRQLKELKKHLGSPISIMRDMSSAMGNAAQEVFKDSVDRVCQFHYVDLFLMSTADKVSLW